MEYEKCGVILLDNLQHMPALNGNDRRIIDRLFDGKDVLSPNQGFIQHSCTTL
jgi:hypothetical protein